MAIKSILVFLFVSFASFVTTAQQPGKTYDKEWNTIDSLLRKEGLAKSALNRVNLIYNAAKKENNDVQVIKALVYRLQIDEEISEEGMYENIQLLEKEIVDANGVAKAILSSIAGGSYWHYLQLNRAQFYDRTRIKNYQSDDIATWDISQLYQKITNHFLASLQEKKLMQETMLNRFDPLIERGNVRHLRPTLYDLLAHRALNYFRNDERYITKPAYAFEIDDSMAFADAKDFIEHTFETADTLSLHHKALLLFQDLLRFHQNDKQKAALADADILRLQFVNNFSTHTNKNELYRQALEKIVGKYPNLPVTADAMYLLAEWHMSKGRSYDPLRDTSQRYELVSAKEWCERALQIRDSSEGKSNARNLLREILRQDISIKTENVNVPGKPFRILINYKNVERGYFRVLQGRGLREAMSRENGYDKMWRQLIATTPLQEFSYQLPATGDHQLHRVEARVNALPTGEYALLVSSNNEFSLEEGTLAVCYFYVSDIAYLREQEKFYVLNRSNGNPLKSASVQIWNAAYDYRTQRVALSKLEKYITDNNGFFRMKRPSDKSHRESYRLEITYGKDRLFISNNLPFAYTYEQPENKTEQTYLFTDRSLYRPGQTVYFKGIAIRAGSKNKQHSILAGRKSVVMLHDVNGEKVDSITLTTNEYGSYNGKFTLPTGMLNGQFRLSDQTSRSEIFFHVEEYKRPKFKVEISQPKGIYRLGDSVTVESNALSYAGNNINGASVKYRVTRRAIIPMWMHGSEFGRMIWPPYPQQEMEIAHGAGTTDATGKFSITFPLIPDKDIPENQRPTFHYHVRVDVTDINGETRTGFLNVTAAYQALKLGMNVPQLLHKDSLHVVPVTSTNMNDSFEAAAIKLSIAKLIVPGKNFRQRYWEEPDQFIMSQDEYYKSFPHDMYAGEANQAKWKIEKSVFQTQTTTTPETKIKIPADLLERGWYVFELTATDKYNKTVVEKAFVQVTDNELSGPITSLKLIAENKVAEPGATINYNILTNAGKAYLIHEVVAADDTTRELITNAGVKRSVNISENHKGSITVKVGFVKNNRAYTELLNIPVPYHDKQLNIHYTSFRDKTLPGVRETWKVKITGMKGDKVAAELLTAMYDASLDQIYPYKAHEWQVPNIWWSMPDYSRWNGDNNFSTEESIGKYMEDDHGEQFVKKYDILKTPDEGGIRYMVRGMKTMRNAAAPVAVADQEVQLEEVAGYATQKSESAEGMDDLDARIIAPPTVQPRKNLNETAFFFPSLYTDSSGNVEFSFTTPEALTTWKWMLLAHTKELAFVYGRKEMITQKQLMVQPNLPRFLREGDELQIITKVANLTGKLLTGTATLQLLDAETGSSLDQLFSNTAGNKTFEVKGGQSAPVQFTIAIPDHYTRPVTWRIIATTNQVTGALSDGEEAMIPVISNRMLVTETLPLPVKGSGSTSFTFDKLINSDKSATLKHHGITVEFTSNPAWYAVQSLPYLAEEKEENAEQAFNRFYANALASKLANIASRLKKIIEQWSTEDSSAFVSNLQKNEELKSVMLQETPWVLAAKTETQQRKNIALLFNVVKLSGELSSALNKLKQMQMPSGGFVWFAGAPEDRYMTQHILAGIGKLSSMEAIPAAHQNDLMEVARKAVVYLDQQIKRDYEQTIKLKRKLPAPPVTPAPVHYLYARSFFQQLGIPANVLPAHRYYLNLVKKDWLKQNTYLKGMIALTLFRTGEKQTAQKIIASLKETAVIKNELGMYWKDMNGGYFWYQAPVETEAVMIEAFSEITNDSASVDNMKTWLLKNKQTNGWRTSKATADACYALLLKGGSWIDAQPEVNISLGSKTISAQPQQAGTGYFKSVIAADSVSPAMGRIVVDVKKISGESGPAWGAVYWQYFENLDKITPASTPLQIKKQLYVQVNTDRGPELQPLGSNRSVKVGDKIKVRLEIRADRTMEYVHLKDMRASGFEPVNAISTYRWQSGVGFYESTKDASTNYYFGVLPKGVHIFEYELFAAQSGMFSNGITTIQCMYAPEFSSHSEGINVNIGNP